MKINYCKRNRSKVINLNYYDIKYGFSEFAIILGLSYLLFKFVDFSSPDFVSKEEKILQDDSFNYLVKCYNSDFMNVYDSKNIFNVSDDLKSDSSLSLDTLVLDTDSSKKITQSNFQKLSLEYIPIKIPE